MTIKCNYLRLALPTPLRRLFDYLPPQGLDIKALKPGMRVRIPFQSRTLVGVLIEVVNKTDVPYGKLKAAIEVLDAESAFTEDVFKICHWAADYYHYSLGEILSTALPVALRKGGFLKAQERGHDDSGGTAPAKARHPGLKHASTGLPDGLQSHTLLPVLNEMQLAAVQTISSSKNIFCPFLLDGITGSGKTEVYLRVIEQVLQAGKQVLVLVPEISLTPQTIQRFESRFTQAVAALHSGLSDKQRLSVWASAKSGETKIVIGTRSAIFTPFASLGLIIIDEEHDASFKQNDRFRYHARDLGVMRASMTHIPIVLGSATPSLESLLNVERGRYQHLVLSERAGGASLPTFGMLDMQNIKQEEGLSQALIDAMRQHLDQGNQVMLFLNRRGFAPVLYCAECATTVSCRRCDAKMVYHRQPPQLKCHHCDARKPVPKKCEHCQAEAMQPVGLGTQRLEETLAKQFPGIPIIRVDRDTTRKKGAMQALLAEIHQQEKAILLGTQMLAKGHHFSNVTLVGVVDADSGLFSSDFRAAEHMGQLLLQVAGRAGRESKPGTVLIQTKHPDHPLLQVLITDGYQAFAKALLQEREAASLPPYTYFSLLRAEAYSEEKANQFLAKIKDTFQAQYQAISLFGPVPAILAKRKGLHSQHLIIKSTHRGTLQSFLKALLLNLEQASRKQSIKWSLDVDPIEVG